MSSQKSFRAAAAALFMAVSLVTSSCSPQISDLDLDRVRAEVETTRKELSRAEDQIKALNAEEKQLKEFKGPDYERRLRQADSLRTEKDQLESIKTEVTAKVARFTSEAKRHRDDLATEKP